jgi:hypothetical protein
LDATFFIYIANITAAVKGEKMEQKESNAVAIDGRRLICKLNCWTEESSDIASYVDETLHHGRALGYAEGKRAAYIFLASKIHDGDFDLEKEGISK